MSENVIFLGVLASVPDNRRDILDPFVGGYLPKPAFQSLLRDHIVDGLVVRLSGLDWSVKDGILEPLEDEYIADVAL